MSQFPGSRRTLALCLALAPWQAGAQFRPPAVLAVGHPARVAQGEALAAVRSFALQRAGARALFAYLEGDDRGRGALRLVALHQGDDGALVRDESDRTVAPHGGVVALWWDGTRGALAWTTPRVAMPTTGRARRSFGPRPSPLEDPLGPPGLSGGAVWFARLDAQGALVGAPVQLFEEHSRLGALAMAPQGAGWRVAWVGATVAQSEVHGTVRSVGVNADGVPAVAASDTGFTGNPGGVLRLWPGPGEGTLRLAWSGQRCEVLAGQAPRVEALAAAPAGEGERRSHEAFPQAPPHEHPGPPIDCGPLRLYAAEVDASGHTGAVAQGPSLAADALSLSSETPVALLREPGAPSRWAAVSLSASGPLRWSDRALAPWTLPAPAAPAPEAPPQAPGSPAAAAVSLVAPPPAPTLAQLVEAPLRFDVAEGSQLVALSPTLHRAVVLASRPAAAARLLAGDPSLFDVQWSVAPRSTWLLVRSGAPLAGPLRFYDSAREPPPEAPAEVPWPGDERLRVHLLRTQAARAVFIGLAGGYGPLFEYNRTDPRLPGMLRQLTQQRVRWRSACDALNERARWLVRQGLSRELIDVGRQQCEIPDDAALSAPDPDAAH